jgi:hypothetical protein
MAVRHPFLLHPQVKTYGLVFYCRPKHDQPWYLQHGLKGAGREGAETGNPATPAELLIQLIPFLQSVSGMGTNFQFYTIQGLAKVSARTRVLDFRRKAIEFGHEVLFPGLHAVEYSSKVIRAEFAERVGHQGN